ncbi:hypothetical protein LUZ60_017722 [Juncus effusus]|nr:hypothetical protein LUZ60_017722 [Juncus effusus]
MDLEHQEPLLEPESSNEIESNEEFTGDGSVDIHGNPIKKNCTGTWRACPFILGNECCERLAYYGISANLVTYLTKKLHQGNAYAARSVTTWAGTCYVTPIIGALLADAYWGRYWTIAVFSIIYFIGMGTLTLSAWLPAFSSAQCQNSTCTEDSNLAQYITFFLGLYLIALGTGGIKPCVSSFGADQFDDTDSEERVQKGSFFNWFYFSINIGALVSSSFLVWVQDNLGWGLGFGIPTVFMGLAIISFFSGTSLYRFQKPGGSPFTRVSQVLVATVKKWSVEVPNDSTLLYEVHDKVSAIQGSRKLEHSDELRCLDKAATITAAEKPLLDTQNSTPNPWILVTVTQVEELKILLRMFPIWATTIIFSSVHAQMSTMFVEQGAVLDTKIGSFTIPPASLSTFDIISVIIWVPVYDRLLVPMARRFTGNERGFSALQRMGVGLFIAILAMAAAAVLEIWRLDVARKEGLVDRQVAVPLSILWQIPQYVLIGAAEVFTLIGKLEFFYDQSPDAMRSLCSAFSLLANAFGNYLSSFILTMITYFSTKGGNPGWIPDNLNQGHLDYYFWLLAGLSFVNLLGYVACAVRYRSKKAT